jgi:hypothetical protein
MGGGNVKADECWGVLLPGVYVAQLLSLNMSSSNSVLSSLLPLTSTYGLVTNLSGSYRT